MMVPARCYTCKQKFNQMYPDNDAYITRYVNKMIRTGRRIGSVCGSCAYANQIKAMRNWHG